MGATLGRTLAPISWCWGRRTPFCGNLTEIQPLPSEAPSRTSFGTMMISPNPSRHVECTELARVCHHFVTTMQTSGNPRRAVRLLSTTDLFDPSRRHPAHACHGVMTAPQAALRRIVRSASIDGRLDLHARTEHPIHAHSNCSLAPRDRRHRTACGRRTSPS